MVVTGLFGACSAEQLVSSGFGVTMAFCPHRFWPSALLSHHLGQVKLSGFHSILPELTLA